MSQSHSRPPKLSHESVNRDGAYLKSENSSTAGHSADDAMDAALRSIPLPPGLMMRLSVLAYIISEDAPDPVDWLGC